jgi:hypothetical protein
MPSSAFNSFRYNVVDVARLIQSHAHLHNGARGKKGLGHITRSGVVMLCASWELYVEDLAIEATELVSNRAATPQALPLDVQKELARHVRESKHDLKPLDLCGYGWRKVLVDHIKTKCGNLNTPKAAPLEDLFFRSIGLVGLSAAWTCGAQALNDFVAVRGDIAHKGRSAPYVSIDGLRGYLDLIKTLTIETDNAVRSHIIAVAGPTRPWNAAS